jgi:iron(III) transport system permease protein
VTLPALDEPAVPVPQTPASLPERSRSLRKPPAWLWAAAIAVLVPVVVPLGSLLWRVAAASDSAWDILFSTRTGALVVRSAGFTLAVTAMSVVLGVAAAWTTERYQLRWRRAWTVLLALPLAIPSYVIALTLISFFGPRGLFADMTGQGLPVLSGFSGAWIALTLSTYPYVFLITRAAVRRLDPALEEAARGLGASPRRVFRTIVIPQLRPSIAAGALLVALYTLSDFGAVSLMRFDAFTRVIYAQYQGRLDRTPAAVLALALIVIAVGILWVEQRTRGRAAYFSRKPARVSRRSRVHGKTAVVAYGFVTGLVAAGLLLPITTLVIWLARGISRGAGLGLRWGSLAGSLSGSLLAAAVAMVAAVPVAMLAVRYRSVATRLLDRSVYVIFSVPHIAVALAVVFFGASYLGPLYQSFVVLVLVYSALFLAQATGAAGAALLNVNPHLEEAARSLGKSPIQTLRSITLPLIRRGLLAGGVLVFLTTMKELPATLLLRPTGFNTLAVDVWSLTAELRYAQAAAPALVLLVAAAGPMYLLLSRSREPLL